jgi:hypothetical protein
MSERCLEGSSMTRVFDLNSELERVHGDKQRLEAELTESRRAAHATAEQSGKLQGELVALRNQVKEQGDLLKTLTARGARDCAQELSTGRPPERQKRNMLRI